MPLSFLLCIFSFKSVDDGKVNDLTLITNFSYEESLIVCSGRRGIDMLIYFFDMSPWKINFFFPTFHPLLYFSLSTFCVRRKTQVLKCKYREVRNDCENVS